ncbi:unnamed protein product [Soboliphyme baturini]|uniref:Serine/threonine-protein kinase receptor n=1 Tax=Soboliphyme baturini TaxID=241478 RepID=A0A183IVV4_9BILA|nr:unnamed protein product [Soboliphyme baturini]
MAYAEKLDIGFSCVLYHAATCNSSTEILHKGCWSSQEDCNPSECAAAGPSTKQTTGPPIYFCCCERPMCNRDFHQIPQITAASSPQAVNKRSASVVIFDDSLSIVKYSLIPIFMIALLILFIFFLYRRCRLNREMKPNSSFSSVSHKLPPSPKSPPRLIQLIKVTSRGRFGDVWKAVMNDQAVAVKIFPAHDVDSWVQEQEIYAVPGLKNHANILRFVTAEVRGTAAQPEYWLVTVFHENGSLYDYLKSHVINMHQLLHISVTMLRGLSFLHEEIIEGDRVYKPTIVHRDFKSRNVLLKTDLSACIADFGLALKCEDGRTPNDTHGQVGTRRYMAPEVLEGATEFSAFAFKQIDVYAAALVLWELMHRCNFGNGPVKDFKLPFEDEIGIRPSLQDMQELVVAQKKRPAIEDCWKESPQGSAICGTMEEMWDSEPEARITTGCALERFLALWNTLPIMPDGLCTEKTPLIKDLSASSLAMV